MSSSKNTSGKTRIALIGGGAAATLGLIGFLVLGSSASSANLSSQTQVGVQGGVGTLDLVADTSVDFSNMNVSTAAHPRVYSQTITFTNNGSLKGDSLKMGVPVNVSDFNVPAGQNPNWSQVHVTVVSGGNTVVNDVPVTSLGSTLELGGMPAHATRSVKITLEIKSAGDSATGDAADNQFQGVHAGGTVTAKLRTS